MDKTCYTLLLNMCHFLAYYRSIREIKLFGTCCYRQIINFGVVIVTPLCTRLHHHNLSIPTTACPASVSFPISFITINIFYIWYILKSAAWAHVKLSPLQTKQHVSGTETGEEHVMGWQVFRAQKILPPLEAKKENRDRSQYRQTNANWLNPLFTTLHSDISIINQFWGHSCWE